MLYLQLQLPACPNLEFYVKMNNVYETALIVLLRLLCSSSTPQTHILPLQLRNRILLVQLSRSLQPAQGRNTQCYIITAVIGSLDFKSQNSTKIVIMTGNIFLVSYMVRKVSYLICKIKQYSCVPWLRSLNFQIVSIQSNFRLPSRP